MSNGKVKVGHLLTKVVSVYDTVAICKEFASCKFGYGFIARSNPKFCAPKQTASLWMERFGTAMPKVVKLTKVTNARSGNYTNKVNKALGGSKDFVADGMNGYEWVVPNVIKRATKDGNLQLCVTFTNGDRTTFESFYIVGDHFATDEELEFIKSRLYVAPSSKKQIESGVSEEDVVMVRNYKFENVVRVGKTEDVEKYWGSIE